MAKSLRGMSKAYTMDDKLKDEYSINLNGKKYPLLSKTFKGFVNKTSKTGKTLFNKIFNSTDAEKEDYIKSVSSVLNLKVDIDNKDVNIKNNNINDDTMVLKNQKNKIVPDDPAYIRELAQQKENEEEFEENNEEYEKELEQMRKEQAYREYVQNQRVRQYQPVQYQQYQPVQQMKYAKGGKVHGASHKNGGVKMKVHKHNRDIEVEGGEYIINKEATKHFEPELNKINKIGLELRDPKNNDKREQIRKKILELKNKKYKDGGKVEYDEFIKMMEDKKFGEGDYLNFKEIIRKTPDSKLIYRVYQNLDVGSKRKARRAYEDKFVEHILPYIKDNYYELDRIFNEKEIREKKEFYQKYNIKPKEEYLKEINEKRKKEREREEKEKEKEKEEMQNMQIEEQRQRDDEERQRQEANKVLGSNSVVDNKKATQPEQYEKIEGNDIRDDGKPDKAKFIELQPYINKYFTQEVDFSNMLMMNKNKEKNKKINNNNELINKIEELFNKINIGEEHKEALRVILRQKDKNLTKALYLELKTIYEGKKIYEEKNKSEKENRLNTQRAMVIPVNALANGGSVKLSDVSNNINKNGKLNEEELIKEVEMRDPIYKTATQGKKMPLNTFNELTVNKDLITTQNEPDTVRRKMFDLPSAIYNVDDRYQGRYAKDIKNVEDEYKSGFKFRIKQTDKKKGRTNLSFL